MQKNQQWKDKVQELFQVCQDELKKTTKIGKKMLSASKTNTNLHDSYEEIGRLAVKALKKGELDWDNSRISELMAVVKTCEQELKSIESDVNKIKFASGPVDISTVRKSETSEKPAAPAQEAKENVAEEKSVKESPAKPPEESGTDSDSNTDINKAKKKNKKSKKN